MIDISAIIPASGLGTRFGMPKIRAKIDGKYFAEIILEKLNKVGIKRVKIVANKYDFDFAVNTFGMVNCLYNDNINLGMIYSVELGVKSLNDSAGFIIFPVDHPLVSTEAIARLIEIFEKNKTKIVKPVYKGLSGHPIIIPNFVVQDISLEMNLNENIAACETRILRVDVDDSAILKNVNNISIL